MKFKCGQTVRPTRESKVGQFFGLIEGTVVNFGTLLGGGLNSLFSPASPAVQEAADVTYYQVRWPAEIPGHAWMAEDDLEAVEEVKH